MTAPAPLKPDTRNSLRRAQGLLAGVHQDLAAAARADPENGTLATLGMGVEDLQLHMRRALDAPAVNDED